MKKQLCIDNTLVEFQILQQIDDTWTIQIEDRIFEIHSRLDADTRDPLTSPSSPNSLMSLSSTSIPSFLLEMSGQTHRAQVFESSYFIDGREFEIEPPSRKRKKSPVGATHEMRSPMPGKILKIFVCVGDQVTLGTPLLVMEAMKMEHTIVASKGGQVQKIFFSVGDKVAGGVELIHVD